MGILLFIPLLILWDWYHSEQTLVHLHLAVSGFAAAPVDDVAVVDAPAEPVQDYSLGFLAHVKHLDGRTTTILINPGDTIGHIKRHIQDAAMIPPDLQRLIYKTKNIDKDDAVLASDLRLYDECTLHLVLRLGGRDKK